MYCCAFLLVVLLSHFASGAEDRVCSKFPYDEALLEKLVRTEMKCEQFQSEFKKLRSNVKTIMVAVQAINRDKINKAEESVKDIQDVKQKGESTTPIIGFRATGVTNWTPSEGDALIFPTVLFNKGGGYNGTSGIFTAPVSGLYLLTVQTCILKGTHSNVVSIMVQGKEMGLLYTGDYSLSVCDSGNAIVYMDAKGEAYMKIKYISGSLLHNDYRMISFAGALLN